MSLEIKPSCTHASVASPMRLPGNIPALSLAEVEAVVRRSRHAAHLRDHLECCAVDHSVLTRDEVGDLIARAGGSGARADGDQAVVLAYYAQKHPEVFAPDAQPLVASFLGDVSWSALMADLRAFMDDLRAREADAQRAEERKKEILADDIKRDDEKRALLRDNGTRSERVKEVRAREERKAEEKQRLRDATPAEVSADLTDGGRLPLSDLELTKLKLHNKGFAHRD